MGAPRRWWPGGRASVSEAGGPGLDSSLARALRSVSARSESFLFNSLYFLQVSISVLLPESKFGLMGAFVTFWDARRPTGWQEESLLESLQLGSLQYPRNPIRSLGALPRTLVFLALIRAAGQCFSWPPWFSTSGNQKSGGRSFSPGRLSEHFRDRNALGFARRRTSKRAATQLNADLKSSQAVEGAS